MDTKDKFIAQLEGFEKVYTTVFSNQYNDNDDSEIAMLLLNQAESEEKSDATANIDNMEKVYNVIQFQVEMMCEFVRASVGSVASKIASDETDEGELLPMFMFVHEKMIKLHGNLDFFYTNFEKEDLKKGFSITRQSVTAMTFSKNIEKDQTIAFVRALKSRVFKYLDHVDEIHNWLHGVLDVLDKELNLSNHASH